MSERVTTGLDDEGRPVARKRSGGAADAVRLRHEAAVLAAARHPGVVELLESGPVDDGGFELTTAFVGAHSLDTVGPLPHEQAAGAVAALAETVADLHDLGVCHGRIDPTHVLLGPGGRPVLCGFAGAGRPGTIPPPSAPLPPDFCDPAADDGAPIVPSVDVFGLGALLRTLVLDAMRTDVEPIPERRWTFARLRRWTGYDRRGLLTLADQATDDDPLRRPSARRFAAAIRDAVPSARLVAAAPSSCETEDDEGVAEITEDPRRPLNRRGPTLVAGVVGLALLLYGVTNLGASTRPAFPRADSAEAAPRPGCSRATGTPVADDLDRDGCPDPVRVAGDGVVAVGSTQFAVGAPGDRIVLGDWDCDGVATPAVLRPATGDVFVFTSWARPGADVAVTAATRVEGAIDLVTQTECGLPIAVLADGQRVEVR